MGAYINSSSPDWGQMWILYVAIKLMKEFDTIWKSYASHWPTLDLTFLQIPVVREYCDTQWHMSLVSSIQRTEHFSRSAFLSNLQIGSSLYEAMLV